MWHGDTTDIRRRPKWILSTKSRLGQVQSSVGNLFHLDSFRRENNEECDLRLPHCIFGRIRIVPTLWDVAVGRHKEAKSWYGILKSTLVNNGFASIFQNSRWISTSWRREETLASFSGSSGSLFHREILGAQDDWNGTLAFAVHSSFFSQPRTAHTPLVIIKA